MTAYSEWKILTCVDSVNWKMTLRYDVVKQVACINNGVVNTFISFNDIKVTFFNL